MSAIVLTHECHTCSLASWVGLLLADPLLPPAMPIPRRLPSWISSWTRDLRWAASAVHAGVWLAGAWLLMTLWWSGVPARPAPYSLQLEKPLDAARRHAGSSPFQVATAAPDASRQQVHDLHLLGVLHSGKGPIGRAIIRQDGAARPLILSVGDEVAHGLRLIRIEARAVVLGDAQGERVLELPAARPVSIESEESRP